MAPYLVAFFIIFWSEVIYAQGTSAMRLDKHEVCGNASNELGLFVTPKNFNRGQQLLDLNFTAPYSFGPNVLVKLTLEKESPIVRNSWIPLISFEVKEGACVAFDKYVGEFGFSLERAIGLPPKVCPFPKGIYHANNVVADFTKLRMPVMPSGKTKVVVELHHKEKNKMVSCQVFILSSL